MRSTAAAKRIYSRCRELSAMPLAPSGVAMSRRVAIALLWRERIHRKQHHVPVRGGANGGGFASIGSDLGRGSR